MFNQLYDSAVISKWCSSLTRRCSVSICSQAMDHTIKKVHHLYKKNGKKFHLIQHM